MPITEYLERNASLYPNEVALVELNPEENRSKKVWKDYSLIESTEEKASRKQLTWREFDEKANRFANVLIRLGYGRGSKVAILLMNCLEWLPIYFGVLKTGAIVVPMNFRYSSEEIQYCLKLSESDVLLFGPEFIGRVEEFEETYQSNVRMIYVGEGNCPTFADDYYEMVKGAGDRFSTVDMCDEDYAAIYFSSGTTGFPKAILHKHKALVHSCKTEQAHHGQTHDDVFLCIPPLYHTGAKMHWFGSLITGSRAVLLKGTKPDQILSAAADEKCTIVWLLVPWAQDILAAFDRGELKPEDYDLSRWRLMHIGAQPVPQSLIKRWLTYFPNHQYDTNYGLSESIGPGCVHLGVENVNKVGAIGKAGYGWQTKICDENGCEVKPGEVGELCVKGPGVMVCYYNDPKATSEVLKDGWLFTGDMAKTDEDGFIYLVDRKKDVIITGGENLYPVQIEDFLSSNPKILDVAVIGLHDSRLGEIAAAIIELKPGEYCTEQDINTFCLRLPRYKRPRKIIFAHVPRNPTGKIEKPLLRRKYGSESLIDDENKA